MTDYRPIDCSLHDRYEAAAVLRRVVRVGWIDPSGEGAVSEGLIRTIRVAGGEEFLVLDDGSDIRLDKIEWFEDLGSRPPRGGQPL